MNVIAEEVVKGRQLLVSLKGAEAAFLNQIQRILDEGDHDSTDRMLWTYAVLAVRELEDLRGKQKTPREVMFQNMETRKLLGG